ncbi:hypothetical protein ZWY2020_022792 [Hordeum vulgare]|nr:hypothetical protein ZWY2020_022792 [Hordeum vulgare]
MVPEQVRAYEFKRRNKLSRFERDSKEYENREKHGRAADAAKGARYGEATERDLQKKIPSYVAEQGGTPRRSPHVACMEKNPGKRNVETPTDYLKRKRPHVEGEAESDNDDFVLADFVRDAQSPAIRKDCATSKCPRVDGPRSSARFHEPMCSQLAFHDHNTLPSRGFTAGRKAAGVEGCDASECVDKDEHLANVSSPPGVVANMEGRALVGVESAKLTVPADGCSAEASAAEESDPAVVPGRHEDVDDPGHHEDVDVPGHHKDVDVPIPHKDVDVDIKNPKENLASIDIVAIFPSCHVAEDIPDDLSVKPHVDESSQYVADLQTFEIADDVDVDAGG